VTSDDNGRPMNVQVVTLLVTPEQSEALALAQVDGRLQLALRNPLDQTEKKPNAVRREHLFQGGTVAPAPPTPTVKPVNRVVPKKVDPPCCGSAACGRLLRPRSRRPLHREGSQSR
jgi:pilus assembly protein CpaB